MNEKEVIRLLNQYRHDVMNELQIIQGYLSIGKIDKVKDKVNSCIDKLNQERKLTNLNTPLFILWLVRFNTLHTNMRATYEINVTNNNLSKIDDLLVKSCQQVTNWIKDVGDRNELYEIMIELNETVYESEVTLDFNINGLFHEEAYNNSNFALHSPVRIEETNDGMICRFLYFL